jgi:RNA polymerase sigma-70 factor (ECF subfamily)
LKAVVAEIDERSLIEAAQRDPRCFGDLYEANLDPVYAYVLSRLADRPEAEDVTAEVFQQALAKLSQFEWRGKPFIAWLLRIASNAIADRYHARSRLQQIEAEDFRELGCDDGKERRAILAQLLNDLPSDQRSVLVERFIHQHSVRDIAKKMGRSEGAIKQLQLRGLQRLRERMGGGK